MPIDRRVQRTRTALYDALVRLIRHMPYAEISVEDILVEADVGRSTFYAHFRSKDELLDRSLERLKQLLVDSIAAQGETAEPGDQNWSRVLFEHVGEYRDIHTTLRDGHGGEVLHAALGRVLGEVLRDILPARTTGGVPRELAVRFVVGTFLTVLDWWMVRHPEEPSAAAEGLFRRLIGHGLESSWETAADKSEAAR